MATTEKQTVRLAKKFQMLETQDSLYEKSKENKVFTDLIPVIASRNNILLAIAKLKTTKKGKATGVDKVTIEELMSRDTEEVIKEVQEKLKGNYEPQQTRRVYIQKPNGKLRPLGIPTTIDSVIQQCILQILEPICESKFSKHSYGFRPMCSVENAIADCMQRMQRHSYTYAVKFDISGFFDNVNHAKLRQQLWSMGIQDKKLLVIINKILKAEILDNEEVLKHTKGTSQGGIISPLLANINLNELDHWIESQWETYGCHGWKDKPKEQFHENGTRHFGHEINKMRKTNLKEIVMVRYADDFIIFCKNRSTAKKVNYAVTDWLIKRLKLEVSPEKTEIINLKRKYCEFLGFKLKLHKKSKKWVCETHISDKKMKVIEEELRKQYKLINKPCDNNKSTIVSTTNSKIIGWHNFYGIATHCNEDFSIVNYKTMTCRYNQLKDQLTREGSIPKTKTGKKYGRSQQIRFIKETKQMLIPIAFTGKKGGSNKESISRNPMCRKVKTCIYNPEHRKAMGWNKPDTLIDLIDKVCEDWYMSPFTMSMQFTMSKIELLHSQKGKCKVTGLDMLENPERIHGHHVKPKSQGGTDNKKNIILVDEKVHKLVHATQLETIIGIIRRMSPEERLALTGNVNKLNKYRVEAGNEPINIRVILKQMKLK